MTHVDDFVDDFGRRDEGELYARWFFFLHRLPAIKKASFCHWIAQFRLFCTFEGRRWRVVGASRMGDVWLTEDFDSEQYTRRVNLDDCSEWSDAPDGDIVEAFAKVRAELKAQGITVRAGDWPEIRLEEPGETLCETKGEPQ